MSARRQLGPVHERDRNGQLRQATTLLDRPLPAVTLNPGPVLPDPGSHRGGRRCSAADARCDRRRRRSRWQLGAGKVAYVTGTTSLGLQRQLDPVHRGQLARIVDLVGYGATAQLLRRRGSGASAQQHDRGHPRRRRRSRHGPERRRLRCTAPRTPRQHGGAGDDLPRPSPRSFPATAVPPTSPVGANITITFSEPVNVTGPVVHDHLRHERAARRPPPAARRRSPSNPDADFVEQRVLHGDGRRRPRRGPGRHRPAGQHGGRLHVVGFTALDACARPFTPIYTIQGCGSGAADHRATSRPRASSSAPSTDTGGIGGFYIQDPTGDGDAATSDGIFVFTEQRQHGRRGDVVRVTGLRPRAVQPDGDHGRRDTQQPPAVPAANIVDLRRRRPASRRST